MTIRDHVRDRAARRQAETGDRAARPAIVRPAVEQLPAQERRPQVPRRSYVGGEACHVSAEVAAAVRRRQEVAVPG
jgi:hypothetical protein